MGPSFVEKDTRRHEYLTKRKDSIPFVRDGAFLYALSFFTKALF